MCHPLIRLGGGFVLLALTIVLLACQGPRPLVTARRPEGVCILTYNDRTAFADREDARIGNAWPQRLPLVRRMLQQLNPDVLGVQEATDGQVQDLAPGFAVLRQEELALLYRTDRLEPLEGGSFELGNHGHPDPWGPRWALWQRFRRKGGGSPFTIFVTHLSTAADQLPQARLALSAAREKATGGEPVLIMGDFNFDASGLLAEYGFQDARPDNPHLTFHAFKGGPGEARLDFIAATHWKPAAAGLHLESERAGEHTVYPSDHYPEWAIYPWPHSPLR
jgi:endonuclease/exonuclease/phosphatase family metal-dependent hydrolase